jgi:GntR family transcriptional regulator of arabinose operon
MDNGNAGALKYLQIYNHYKNMLESRTLNEGDRLPSENAICGEFGVSRITVTKALNILASEGLIRRMRGGGTFVLKRKTRPLGNGLEFISYVAPFRPLGREIDLIRGIENTVKASGFLFTVSNCDDNPDAERGILQNMRQKARGIIVYPARSNLNADLFYRYYQEDYPIVFVDHAPVGNPCSFAVSDNRDGGYRAAKLLLERGVSRILMIFHNLTECSSELDRYNGFTDALSERALPRSSVEVIHIQGMDLNATALATIRQVLDQDGGRPAGLFICNAVVAGSVVRTLQAHGVSLSKDLLLATFDDINDAALLGTPVLSVRQDYYVMGEEAAKILLEKIRNEVFFERRIHIPVHVAFTHAFGTKEQTAELV